MTRQSVVIVSVLVGLVAEVLAPLPGVVLAEIVVGLRPEDAARFLAVACSFNFFLFAGMAYIILTKGEGNGHTEPRRNRLPETARAESLQADTSKLRVGVTRPGGLMVQETPECQVGNYVRIVEIPVLHDVVGCVAAIDATRPVAIYAVALSPFPERYFVELLKRELMQGTGMATQGANSSPPALALIHFFSSHNIQRINGAIEEAAVNSQFTEKFADLRKDVRSGRKEAAKHATNSK
jgi:hypothetical protein